MLYIKNPPKAHETRANIHALPRRSDAPDAPDAPDAAGSIQRGKLESGASLGVHCAGERHNTLRSLHSAGNEALYGFIQELRIFNDWRQYYELGFPSLAKYCESQFGIARSTAHCYVRVAKRLADLPCTRSMFRDGDLSWSQIREITRVATAGTESDWIELAITATVRELVAERRQAERAGRAAPVDGRFGLPNLMVHVGVDVTIEEKQRILAAFACVNEALGEDVGPGDDAGTTRPALLRWADGVLAGTIPVARAADGERSAPAQAILYRSDPETGRACVETEDGRVAVPAERIEELSPHAVQIEITREDEQPLPPLPEGEVDGPNTATIRLQTLARDGLKCAHCGDRRHVQVHHRCYRADGGRTALFNLIPLCRVCHGLEHDDLLDIRGRPGRDLRFVPTPMIEGVRMRDVDTLRAKVRQLAAEVATSEPADPGTGGGSRGRQGGGRAGDRGGQAGGRRDAAVEGGPDEQRSALRPERRIQALAAGLREWGYHEREAAEALSDAYFELAQKARIREAEAGQHAPEITDEDLLRLALSNRGRQLVGERHSLAGRPSS